MGTGGVSNRQRDEGRRVRAEDELAPVGGANLDEGGLDHVPLAGEVAVSLNNEDLVLVGAEAGELVRSHVGEVPFIRNKIMG